MQPSLNIPLFLMSTQISIEFYYNQKDQLNYKSDVINDMYVDKRSFLYNKQVIAQMLMNFAFPKIFIAGSKIYFSGHYSEMFAQLP